MNMELTRIVVKELGIKYQIKDKSKKIKVGNIIKIKVLWDKKEEKSLKWTSMNSSTC